MDTPHPRRDMFAHLLRQLRGFSSFDFVERCGLIFWRTEYQTYQIHELSNIAVDKRYYFALDGHDVREAIRIRPGDDVVGVFHTHVERDNRLPSGTDHEELGRLRGVSGYEDFFGIVYHPRSRFITQYDPYGIVNSTRVPYRRR